MDNLHKLILVLAVFVAGAGAILGFHYGGSLFGALGALAGAIVGALAGFIGAVIGELLAKDYEALEERFVQFWMYGGVALVIYLTYALWNVVA